MAVPHAWATQVCRLQVAAPITRVYCIALIRVLMPAVSCTVRVSKKCAIAARLWRSEADGVFNENTDLQMVAQPSYPSSLKRSTRRR